MKKRKGIALVLGAALGVMVCLTGCGAAQSGYTQISQEEARQIMEDEEDFLLLDVRRLDEYESGHIPGAVLLPNEEIGNEESERVTSALPDKDQKILVYCRSGNRSKQASEKLAKMGYTNVLEFGGIMSWTGEVVKGSEPGGKQKAEGEEKEEERMGQEEKQLTLLIGEEEVPVTWEENASAAELKALAGEEGLTVSLSMYGGFEQVGSLGRSITRDDVQTVTQAGDIVLYSGNQIVLFYGSNSWAYTRLGHIGLSPERMEELLGHGDVTITLR